MKRSTIQRWRAIQRWRTTVRCVKCNVKKARGVVLPDARKHAGLGVEAKRRRLPRSGSGLIGARPRSDRSIDCRASFGPRLILRGEWLLWRRAITAAFRVHWIHLCS